VKLMDDPIPKDLDLTDWMDKQNQYSPVTALSKLMHEHLVRVTKQNFERDTKKWAEWIQQNVK